jgi:hypothetical protein
MEDEKRNSDVFVLFTQIYKFELSSCASCIFPHLGVAISPGIFAKLLSVQSLFLSKPRSRKIEAHRVWRDAMDNVLRFEYLFWKNMSKEVGPKWHHSMKTIIDFK